MIADGRSRVADRRSSTALGLVAIGLLGVWEAALETLALMLVSVSLALAIGIPFGIWAGLRPRVERVLRPILDAMQTIPAFSYLLPCVPALRGRESRPR